MNPTKRVLVAVTLLLLPIALFAQQGYTGLSLSTDFPAITTTPGQVITLPVEVHNYGLAPQRVDLGVVQGPDQWETVFVGGGNITQAVFVAPGENASADLWLEPPKNAAPGSYEFVLQANGRTDNFNLPVTVELGEQLPQRLSVSAEFPSLSGTPDTDFTYRLTIENTSAQNAVVNLQAQAPSGFQVTFTEAVGDTELTSIPIDAGNSTDVQASVSLPENVSEGSYEVIVLASTEVTEARQTLTLNVEGQPELSVSGPQGRVSTDATAGQETAVQLTLRNEGSAPANNLSFNASPPQNWSVTFEPSSLDQLAPGASRNVTALITPAAEALAGDYMVNMQANGQNVSSSVDFRVTVNTSTLWGIIAVLIIAAAVVVVVLAVMRFGRR